MRFNLQKIFVGLLIIIIGISIQSCGGRKTMGSGKQKKNCNCGF
jgi:hypothetical protein